MAPSEGFNLESEAACRHFCNVYADLGQGCTFAAWAPREDLNCMMYKIPFWQFLKTCKLLGAPSNLAGCEVEHPEDNTCDAVR